MTSHYFDKKSPIFNFQILPETPPAKGEAIVVIADVATIKVIQLPQDEVQRAEQIFHEPSRERYLSGRYLLRGVLSRWFDVNPQDMLIALSPTGKPFLPQHECQFSISHAEQIVAAVFSGSTNDHPMAVGIDVERERALDLIGLSQRFFSSEEAEWLQQSPSLDEFFKLWCCREASIKADGRGLGQLLAETKVSTHKSSLAADEGWTFVSVEGILWSCYHWLIEEKFHAAVAFQQQPQVIHWCDLRERLD